jgi:excisionase family DNA binding protein
MNKTDAAKYLGIGVRSLERYTSDKRITPDRVKAKTGFALDYSTEALDTLKAELEASAEAPAPLSPPSVATALARLPRHSTAIVSTAPQPRREKPFVPVEFKMLLTLDEVSALTGLSRSTLRSAIDEGTFKAAVIGRAFRVRPDDLKKYLAKLF